VHAPNFCFRGKKRRKRKFRAFLLRFRDSQIVGNVDRQSEQEMSDAYDIALYTAKSGRLRLKGDAPSR
jgi:hypothetical protein